MSMPDISWMERATCRRLPGRWWEIEGAEVNEDNKRALKVCRTACPVVHECFDYALNSIPGKLPRGVIMAGVKFSVGKKMSSPRLSIRICSCGAFLLPWVPQKQTECELCLTKAKNGAKVA